MVSEGNPAPDFTLASDSGEMVTLSSFRGSPIVLFFYPKSDTPGCTRQACGIRDAWHEFERRGAVVLGVSSDTQAAQARFKAKYELPFPVQAGSSALRDQLGVRGYPTILFLRDGVPIEAISGVTPATRLEAMARGLGA